MMAENKAQDVLQRLIGVFEGRGWLNQTLRIRLRERRYRIFCSGKKFLAYRINDKGSYLARISWLACVHHHY